jgi:aminopeptidase
MTDPRYTKLAQLLVEYSTKIGARRRGAARHDRRAGRVLGRVDAGGAGGGGTPLIEVRHTRVTREVMRGTDEAHAKLVRDLEMFRMKKVQAYIAVRGAANANESSDVPRNDCGCTRRRFGR